MIRTVEGSEDSEINTLAVSKDGDVFVSAGNDRLVKLWGYDDAQCYRVGQGHAGAVNKVACSHQVAIAPNQQHVVSVGSEGAIFVWKLPQDVIATCKQASMAIH